MSKNSKKIIEIKFTNEKIEKIKSPKVKVDIYKDKYEKGFYLRVGRGGSKVFYLYKNINSKPTNIKLGEFPYLTVEDAKIKIFELKKQISNKIDPTISITAKAQKQEITFKELYNQYMRKYAIHNLRPKSQKDFSDRIKKYATGLYDYKLSQISKTQILDLFNDASSKGGIYTANRLIDVLSIIFNKGIEWEMLEKNPCAGIKKHKEQSRERFLETHEIPKFFEALEADSNEMVKDFLKICLFTGARKGNILAMSWEDINFEKPAWTIDGRQTKNGRSQILPLVPAAVELLKERQKTATGKWVFPSETSRSGHLEEPKKVWHRILKRAGITNFRIHDLRRTLGSWMAINGTSMPIIGKSLNHKNPASTAIYARLNTDPVREHMCKAIETIENINSLGNFDSNKNNTNANKNETKQQKIERLEQQIKLMALQLQQLKNEA